MCSFLRLARVPFEGTAADGAKLALLRVEVDSVADVGSITPHLGGASRAASACAWFISTGRGRV
jgi:hypothetical protein